MPDAMIDLPLTITIPVPCYIPGGSGVTSTIGPDGCLIQCRGLESEKDEIKKAAKLVGVTYGTFLRSVAITAAAAFLKAARDQGVEIPEIIES